MNINKLFLTEQIKSLFLALCPQSMLHGVCDVPTTETLFDGQLFQYTQSELALFPTITFKIYNILLSIEPSGYLRFNGDGYYELFIVADWTDLPILGYALIKNFHVVFDLSISTIGFGSVNTCPLWTIPPKVLPKTEPASPTVSPTTPPISIPTAIQFSGAGSQDGELIWINYILGPAMGVLLFLDQWHICICK